MVKIPFPEPEYSARKQQPGRNDPCPCGSGKKYKQCCMSKDSQHSASELLWRRLGETSDKLANQLLNFFMERLDSEALMDAWSDYLTLRAGRDFDPDDPEIQCFMPWMFYNWSMQFTDGNPETDEIDEKDTPSTIAEYFLAANRRRLTEMEKRFIQLSVSTNFSFYEVVDCQPGKGFTLRDLLLSTEVYVYERAASTDAQPGDVIFAKVVRYDDVATINGCGTVLIPPRHKPLIIDLREAMQEGREHTPLDGEDLQDWEFDIPAQMVRYRLLNDSSHRFFNFGFANNKQFHQIASDAGLLDAPVSMTRLTLAPGERAEILVDLSSEQGNTLTLKSFGTELPQGFPGGTMMMGGMEGPLDNTDFTVLTINVGAPTANPVTTVPTALTINEVLSQNGATSRQIGFTAQPMMSMTNFFINNKKFDMEQVEFTTEQGRVEVWNITNQTMMAHPFHIHGNHFYVLQVNGATPPPNQRGRKDVVTVPPMNGSVKLITKYENYGDPVLPYMFHCHILSHAESAHGMFGMVTAVVVNE